jgi:hypothetical protein
VTSVEALNAVRARVMAMHTPGCQNVGHDTCVVVHDNAKAYAIGAGTPSCSLNVPRIWVLNDVVQAIDHLIAFEAAGSGGAE